MMLTIDIERLFPRFILNDKNGYAMAKAIVCAMEITCQTVQNGIDNVLDVEKMPEWRLDEMAWELDCLFDYNADIESKRAWIREAVPIFSTYGTPEAIYKTLDGYFDDTEVEENWQYSGEPYHFRVTVSGDWTDAKEQWARKAVEAAKNVRSVLDSIAIGSRCTIKMRGEGGMITRFFYPVTGPDAITGTIPQENMLGRMDGSVFSLQADARGHVYDYPISGTQPEINMIGQTVTGGIRADGKGTGHTFGYPQTSEGLSAGLVPYEAMTGGISSTLLNASGEARASVYPYPITGTAPQENTLAALSDGGIRASPDGQKAAFPYTACGDRVCGQDDL